MNPNETWYVNDVLDFGGGLGGDPWTPPIDLGGGNGGSGSGDGGWWGVADDLLEDLGVYDWIGNLINPGGGGGGAVSQGDKEKALLILAKDQSTLSAFYSFLQDLGVYGSILAQMVSGSILSWPGLIQDAILYWASKNRPGAFTTDGQFIDNNFLGDFKDGAQYPIGPPLPGGGSGLPTVPGGGYGPFAAPVIPATPVQVYKARKGYVIVRDPATGAKYEMMKELAYKLGLAKRRKKAPITAREYDAIKKAQRFESKLARMMKSSCNYRVTKKR